MIMIKGVKMFKPERDENIHVILGPQYCLYLAAQKGDTNLKSPFSIHILHSEKRQREVTK